MLHFAAHPSKQCQMITIIKRRILGAPSGFSHCHSAHVLLVETNHLVLFRFKVLGAARWWVNMDLPDMWLLQQWQWRENLVFAGSYRYHLLEPTQQPCMLVIITVLVYIPLGYWKPHLTTRHLIQCTFHSHIFIIGLWYSRHPARS